MDTTAPIDTQAFDIQVRPARPVARATQWPIRLDVPARRPRRFRRVATLLVACCMGSWVVVAAIPTIVFLVSIVSH